MNLAIDSILVGGALGLLVSGLAFAAGTLTGGGALAAAVVGAVCYGIGGIRPALLLLLFFGSSSVLSRLGGRRKQLLAGDQQKSGPRDQGQVLANGVIAAVLAAGYGLTGELGWLVAVAGALAASNADTWGTELGVLSPVAPRLITTGRSVEPGSSGAITAAGTVAALAGAALIALAATAMTGESGLLVPITSAGLLASLTDSLFGATVQAVYFCPNCGRATEAHPDHSCGGPTTLMRGWKWMGNDQVNLLASALGALLSTLAWAALR